MKNTKIEHKSCLPYQFITENKWLYLVIKTNIEKNLDKLNCEYSDPSEAVYFPTGERSFYLKTAEPNQNLKTATGHFYFFKLKLQSHKLRYYFTFYINDKKYYFDERGINLDSVEDSIRGFFVNYCYFEEKYQMPEFAKDTIWYQIFPDRFSNENFHKKTYPDLRNEKFKDYSFGGTITGIKQKLEYIKNLGCNGIYLNPIFKAFSVHKYDTIDYYSIDTLFGDETDFASLCKACHSLNMKIMLDGVYNHCSDKSPQFMDVLYKGDKSKYYNWFILQDKDTYNLNLKYNESKNHSYEVFGFVSSMPKWNTKNPEVMDYLINSAIKWTREYKIDAWRLDVPDEINDNFLRKFTTALKNENPQIYIIGEIWSDPMHWLSGDMFSGVMNYTLYFIVRDFVSETIDGKQFCNRLLEYYAMTPLPIQEGMFNFCGNHDLPRIMHFCNGNKKKVILAFAIILAMPGNSNCYYGDEIFLEGIADPCNRGVFPWGKELICDENNKVIKELFEYYHRYSRNNLKIKNVKVCSGVLEIVTKNSEGVNKIMVNIEEKEKIVSYNNCITSGKHVGAKISLSKFEFIIVRK